jgi:hypothetical protein
MNVLKVDIHQLFQRHKYLYQDFKILYVRVSILRLYCIVLYCTVLYYIVMH